MGKVVRTTRPDLYLYKHRHTRSELSVDEAGVVYRFIPPRSLDSRGDGRYLAHRDHLPLV